jgi:hypothetical protein
VVEDNGMADSLSYEQKANNSWAKIAKDNAKSFHYAKKCRAMDTLICLLVLFARLALLFSIYFISQ